MDAVPVAVFRHKALLICVNRSVSKTSLYDATRYAWIINPRRAEEADVILATVRGLILGAFVADEWKESVTANFPDRQNIPGRCAFIGREAPRELWDEYVHKRVPDEYRKRGAANPITYTW